MLVSNRYLTFTSLKARISRYRHLLEHILGAQRPEILPCPSNIGISNPCSCASPVGLCMHHDLCFASVTVTPS